MVRWLLGLEAGASAGVNQLEVLEGYHEESESAAAPHKENCYQGTEDDVPEDESAAL